MLEPSENPGSEEPSGLCVLSQESNAGVPRRAMLELSWPLPWAPLPLADFIRILSLLHHDHNQSSAFIES